MEVAAPSQSPREPAKKPLPAIFVRPLRWCRKCIQAVGQFLIIAWATLAIYYSNLPWTWMRAGLAAAFAVFGAWALWTRRDAKWHWAFAGAFVVVVIWWLCIPPSHHRPWRTEAAVLPRASIEGDRVRLSGVRNFVYRGAKDFDVRYEEREISLAHVVSVDLFISYWQIGPMAHTFLSFNFDDGAKPVAISIEARPENGERFSAVASMFRQFELFYVVGDERDIVRVRTEHRNEEVFLYRIRATPEEVQRLFRVYLERINAIAGRPEWYHLLSNNCTVNIIRCARAAGGRNRFDHRHLFNGLIDRYVYGANIVDTTLSFEELRRRSHINSTARAAGDAEDFSARIRASLPVPTPSK
jgi:hypothetical protein